MDGKLDGSLEDYYPNSQISEETNFREAKFGGPFTSYLDDGQLQKKASHDVDRMCCEWFDLGGTRTHDPSPPAPFFGRPCRYLYKHGFAQGILVFQIR